MREPCPSCRETGRDNSGDNLYRYQDGTAYCHACHYYENDSTKNTQRPRMSKLTVSQVESYPFGSDPKRKIPTIIASLYGVRCSVSTSTGQPETIYYPYYDESGKHVKGYKVRELPKTFKPSAGKIGETLWGINTFQPSYKTLILTEGEEDALAIRAMQPTQKINIGSLPNGASMCAAITDAYDHFDRHDKVYLILDPDKAGKSAVSDIADYISCITNCYIVELDPSIGDPSDYWQANRVSEFKSAVSGATLYEPEGVVNGTDIDLADLLVPLAEGYPVPFAGIQEKIHGVRKGELVTVCAGSGIGKSTLVREITLSLIKQGLSVANVALEDQMDEAVKHLIAMDMNIPMNRWKFSPPPEADVKPHYDNIIANGRTFFYKHFAGITADSLMNKMYYYARSKQVDFIILDHLSMVISSSSSQNERKDIDTLMTNLAKMVVETGVGLIQIVHLKRTGGDKSFAKGGEVELTDLRGSAALEQLSWCVIGLERDQQGDDKDFSRARILKNRTFGFTGLADHLKYDPQTGRMSSYIPEDMSDDEPTELQPVALGGTEQVLDTGHRNNNGSQDDPLGWIENALN